MPGTGTGGDLGLGPGSLDDEAVAEESGVVAVPGTGTGGDLGLGPGSLDDEAVAEESGVVAVPGTGTGGDLGLGPGSLGTLLVVSGPSGVGKSSVVHALAERVPFHFSVSWTTRSRRPGEQDGVDYVYVTRDQFEEAIEEGGFLGWAEYSGHLYGTPRQPVLDQIECGENVILDIENDGALQVKTGYPQAVLLFILPPSMAELERRLRGRGDTSEADINKRLAVAQSQIDEANRLFDHLVTNTEVGVVADEIVSILANAQSP